jgi:FixJ family two-component response regulator
LPADAGRFVAVDSNDHIVFIVDDDRSIRAALTDLLASFDMQAVAFGSAE